MINKEITSKAEAKRVANLLKGDLLQSVEIYGDYEAELFESGSTYKVEFYSLNSCPIITSSVFCDAFKVVEVYMVKYQSISFWIETTDLNGKIIPMISLNISWKK